MSRILSFLVLILVSNQAWASLDHEPTQNLDPGPVEKSLRPEAPDTLTGGPPPAQKYKITADMWVMNAYGFEGRVQRCYSDGRCFVRINDHDYIYASSTLVPQVENLGVFREGVSVLNYWGSPGRVRRVFADGRVVVEIGGTEYHYWTRDLSVQED